METLDFANPEHWNTHIGRIWEQIFKECSLPKEGVVVEIAPGDADKVGRGLSAYKFNGTLYVIEPNGKTLATLSSQYLADFPRVCSFKHTLDEARVYLPNKVNAIFANHPLDDMIIGMTRDDVESQQFYDAHYGMNQGERTRAYWNRLEANPRLLEAIKCEVLNEWNRLFKSTKPDLVVISQYESYFFKSHNITAPDKHAFDLLERMREQYTGSVNEVIEHRLAPHVNGASRWLVLHDPAR